MNLFILFLAAATGYLSLSQELLWMRAVSYMTGSRPSVFAHVLGFFLVGVAVGALIGERICARSFGARSPRRLIGWLLLISGLFYYFSISAVASLLVYSSALGLLATHIVVALVAMLMGIIFPILCHLGVQAGKAVGLGVSRIYMANIVGATLGPLFTGFVLMQVLSTDRIILSISLATLILAAICIRGDLRLRDGLLWSSAASILAIIVLHSALYGRLIERLHATERPQSPYKLLVENRSGIIAVTDSPTGDVIYGGGMYDGRFTTDPVIDSNGIKRAYMIAGLHPQPQDVLVVGLASGSWVRVLEMYQPIRQMTVVEINPGYLRIIDRYPEQAHILRDPRIRIHIDDGRRWLNRNPDARFDFILQNTTWHWRSHASNLLSADYFNLCKHHLKPGGVIYVNSTWCDDVPFTAAHVFKHVVRHQNFIAASDAPFDMPLDRIRENLGQFRVDGRPYLDPQNPALAGVIHELTLEPWKDLAPEFRPRRDLHVITDDNMAAEYRQQKWLDTGRTWANLFRRLTGGQP